MLPSRELAEACVVTITTAVLGVALARSNAANPWLAASLVCLTAAALAAESVAAAGWGRLYRQRRAGSSGLALGALALPWAYAGLVLKHRQQAWSFSSGIADSAAFTATAASAATALLLLLRLQLQGVGPADGRRVPALPPLGWRGWVCAGAMPAVLAGCAAAESRAGSGLHHPLALLVAAAAAAGGTHLLLSLLPRVCTLGEGLVAAQAAALLGAAALRQLPLAAGAAAAPGQVLATAPSPYLRFVVLLAAGSVLAAALLIPLLQRAQQAMPVASRARTRRRSRSSSSGVGSSKAWVAAAAAVAALAAAAAAPAAAWAMRFALSSRRRALLCAWWAADLAVALPVQHWVIRSGRVPAILVRKGYHLLAVALFLPALLLEPQLLGVALAAAFALLLAAEALRLSGLPGVAPRLHAFMTSFTDGRDSGLLLVTHLTLLLGMAAPVWLSNALDRGALGGAADAAGAGERVWPAAYAGILVVGLGDTAASAVGSLLGRWRICRGSRKTVEGTCAAAAATLAGWWLLAAADLVGAGGGGPAGSACAAGGAWWARLVAATALSCVLEAVTEQLDNLFVPLHYFALLCLL